MNDYKLMISDFYEKKLLGFQMVGNRLERIFDFSDDSLLGDIYCGYVKDVVKNINAAFVEFSEDKKGYLSIKNYVGQVRQGDRVLVQVTGDKIKNKEYTLTGKINLNSSCLVLTAGNTDISVSRKIEDVKKREELKKILLPFKNDEYGFILRTNSVHFSSEDITQQAKELIWRFNGIRRKFQHSSPKSVIIKNNYMVSMCTEFIKKYQGRLITDVLTVFDTIKAAGLPIDYYKEERISLCNHYSLTKHLRDALSKKVWLKSGAYLVIEPTEALTVIDVNTGKADIKTERENTFQKINMEAAMEIARQIRVRNLSGIIIIDFINMKAEENYTELKEAFENAIKYDFTQCNVSGFTRLGLLELSRKKQEKPLHEILKNH